MAAPAATGSYIGEVKHQLRNGFGRYVYPNSFFQYEGEWKDGKKHGHGKFLMKDGSYYEGEFVNGEIEGNGFRYWASSGNEYCGQFSQGEVHGHGVMKYSDGALYEGEFYYGFRAGHGVLTDKGGQIYQGSFHNHMKHGEGEMFYKNGDHYQGDWVLDQHQGHGVMQSADGSLYEGQWRNGLFNGQGSIIHCSGVVYDGMWINGHPVGEATKLVILGEPVQEVVQRSSFTIEVQLQNNEGEVIEAENGRLLQIWAGVKHIQLSPTLSNTSLQLTEDLEEPLVETPYGYSAVSYPLVEYVLDSSTIASAESEITPVSSWNVKDSEVNSSKLDFLAETGSPCGLLDGTPDPSYDNEGKGTKHQEEGALYGFQDLPAEDKGSTPMVANKRVERGYAAFQNIALAAPPACYHPFMILDELEKKASKKSSSRTQSDKGTISQEKISESRSDVSVKLGGKSKKAQSGTDLQSVRLGDYVIMVKDVTSPPFLARTLPPAFMLLKVIPQKTSKKGARKEPYKVPSK
ncbi:MORN repeat-containing protein 1-like isoform X1 [Hypanus sabinus]|uniref:MORN repeat-containing protein 1-like isoform X1 n=1 Tax=Hypanus sabinus TaxID=79690 RepID=UPI0028C4C16E|nr:MORN repeat-containing protein 1-like isoform X1 [Hypanus sabinus]